MNQIQKILWLNCFVFFIAFQLFAQENKTIVFVHGAFQDGSSWDEVRMELESQGFKTFAPDLPGHGRYSLEKAGEIKLDNYIETISKIIKKEKGKVILVGHSFGGYTISAIAEKMPDKIEKLVYVASYIPVAGQSFYELSQLDKNNGFTETNFVVAEDYTFADIATQEDIINIFCQDCDNFHKKKTLEHHYQEPLAPFQEKLTLTKNNFGKVKKVFIRTTKDQANSPQLQEMMLKRSPVDTVYELPTSHSPFYTYPKKLAELIIK